MSAGAPRDWTAGPARWAAVAVLGGASLTGIVWSIATGQRRPSDGVVVAPPATGRDDRTPGHANPGPGEPGPRAARVDLNTATRAQLEALPGVGPELADRIIEFRAARGGFKDVQQLDNVKGIGPKLLEKIRPLVTVGTP